MSDSKIKDVSPEAAKALVDMIATIREMARENPLAIERVAELFESEPQAHVLTRSLLGLLPSELDQDLWLGWLERGETPYADITLKDPDQGRKKSARGAYHAAASRLAEATRVADEIEARLAEARAVVADRRKEMREASNQMRAVVVHRMVMMFARLFVAPFSLGPVWTIMRATSAYLCIDTAYERSLDPEAATALAEHRATRKAGSAEIMDLLDRYCGDVSLEVKLHTALLTTLREHHTPVANEIAMRNYLDQPLSAAARRTRRSSEERRASVRPGAPISDRHEVLAGLVGEGDHAGNSDG